MLSTETIERAKEGSELHSLFQKTEWFLGERTKEENPCINKQRAKMVVYLYLEKTAKTLHIPGCFINPTEILEISVLDFLVQYKLIEHNYCSVETALDYLANEIIDKEFFCRAVH